MKPSDQVEQVSLRDLASGEFDPVDSPVIKPSRSANVKWRTGLIRASIAMVPMLLGIWYVSHWDVEVLVRPSKYNPINIFMLSFPLSVLALVMPSERLISLKFARVLVAFPALFSYLYLMYFCLVEISEGLPEKWSDVLAFVILMPLACALPIGLPLYSFFESKKLQNRRRGGGSENRSSWLISKIALIDILLMVFVFLLCPLMAYSAYDRQSGLSKYSQVLTETPRSSYDDFLLDPIERSEGTLYLMSENRQEPMYYEVYRSRYFLDEIFGRAYVTISVDCRGQILSVH